MAIDRSINSFGVARTRAKRRSRYRDVCALLVQRAELLSAADRALVVAVYADGRTVMSIARRDDPDPSTLVVRAAVLRRHVRRLARRLLNPAFELVRSTSNTWPPVMARVGQAVFIQGLSMRETSQRLHLSLYSVRSSVYAIRALAAAHRSIAALPQVAA